MSDAISHEPRGSTPQAHSLERPKKRQKIAVACDACRARKVKCDGVRPVCGVCVRRKSNGLGSNCSYGDAKDGTPIASRWSSQTSELQDPRSSFSAIGQPFPSQSPIPPTFNVFEVRRDVVPKPGTAQEGSKVIDSMTGVIDDHDYDVGFFGSSSAGSFMRQIKSAIDAKVGITSRRQSFSGGVKASKISSSQKSQSNDVHRPRIQYILPSRRAADELMSVYWTKIHSLYPFLDPESYQKAYESIWSGSTPAVDERNVMCSLNVLFALSCQLSDSIKPEDREEASKAYFTRAQELLQVDLWDVGSVELIQCLLLMGQYLQSTSSPHQCWMVIGHAIRIAQGLGFHLPDSSAKALPYKKRQSSRIVWHGCVLMDRVLSMTFGRPAMIAKSFADAVPLPETSDFTSDSFPQDMRQQKQPSRMAFFVESLRLYDIMNDILLNLYTNHEHFSPEGGYHAATHKLDHDSLDLATTLQLDQALMQWGQSLPPHLRISSPESAQSTTFQMQSIVCRCRFLHARILLFRPALARFCLFGLTTHAPGTALDESLGHRVVLQCSSLCVTAAHNTIQLIHSNLVREDLTGPLPAWWYCILYVYTAATVLLAARLHPILNAGFDVYSIAESWDHAIQVLKAFERLGPSAQRCVAALEILSAKVGPRGDITGPSNEAQAVPEFDDSTNIAEGSLGNFAQDFDFNAAEIDMSDMSWLNILPGNLG